MNQVARSEVVVIDMAEIDKELRPASQMRCGLNQEAIENYAAHVDDLPPVKLKYDRKAKCHWVVDGAHTITAARTAGRKTIPAIVSAGSYEDAWREAARENEGHGVRITKEDRHERLRMAKEIFPGLSSRQYAELCNVSHFTAQKVLGQLEGSSTSDEPDTVIGKDGKRYAKHRQSRQARQEPFTCPQCGEEFNAPVWHCSECGEHWPDSENVCPTCWNPDEVQANPSLKVDPPREPLPGQRNLFEAEADEATEEKTEDSKTARQRKREFVADRWVDLIGHLDYLANSVTRAGGFDVLCEGWPRSRIERQIKHIEVTLGRITELMNGLKGVLK